MLANIKTLTFPLVAAFALIASTSAYAGNGFGNFPGGGVQFDNGLHDHHRHHPYNGDGGIVPPHVIKKQKFVQPFRQFPQFHDGHFHDGHFHDDRFHGHHGGGIQFHFGK